MASSYIKCVLAHNIITYLVLTIFSLILPDVTRHRRQLIPPDQASNCILNGHQIETIVKEKKKKDEWYTIVCQIFRNAFVPSRAWWILDEAAIAFLTFVFIERGQKEDCQIRRMGIDSGWLSSLCGARKTVFNNKGGKNKKTRGKPRTIWEIGSTIGWRVLLTSPSLSFPCVCLFGNTPIVVGGRGKK